MSKLAEFRALEQQLAAQLAKLEALKKDDGLKREMEFEEKLRALMSKYGKGLRDIVAILDPQTKVDKLSKQDTGVRRPRQVKRYKNPKTGEVVETKGGNHKVLKAWKEEFDADVVESWLQ